MGKMEGRSEGPVGIYEKNAGLQNARDLGGGVFHVWRQRREDFQSGGL